MDIKDLLNKVYETHASDLHLTVGAPPTLRIDGELSPLPHFAPLKPDEAEELIFEMLSEEQKELLLVNKEVDFSFSLANKARFRVNAFHQKGYLACAVRLIPLAVPKIPELNLPDILHKFCGLPQGFIVVTGPTGHGKSTTIAAIIAQINDTRNVHIVTIEDPIEYIYPHKKSLVDQREMHLDTHSWEVALRSALREDPDVVVVGEMRDYETVASAVTIAETGHLVFATLHTNSASQSVDRIIDVFPEQQQQQIRVQLSGTLEAVISQRLLPAIGGGRIPAVEIMVSTPAIKTLIREGKTHQIDNVIATSADVGMISLERSLADLVRSNRISEETAFSVTLKPAELNRLLRR